MRQEGEPSVEEILESIKKVIARDNRAEAAEERRQLEEASLPDEDDLIEEVAVLDLSADSELIDDSDDEVDENAPLLTDDARMSMQDSFAALAMLSEPSARPQIVRSGETSLEGMVRELLRPALAQWLESNLPEIVERLVAAEISRIAGKKG